MAALFALISPSENKIAISSPLHQWHLPPVFVRWPANDFLPAESGRWPAHCFGLFKKQYLQGKGIYFLKVPRLVLVYPSKAPFLIYTVRCFLSTYPATIVRNNRHRRLKKYSSLHFCNIRVISHCSGIHHPPVLCIGGDPVTDLE
jgi:hypothetical protein